MVSSLWSLLVPFAILELIGYFILWPVIKKKPRLRIPRQFSIADFAALLCYVQLVMTLTFYYRRLFENSIGTGVALSILGGCTAVLWGAAVSMLNQLEMHSTVRRMLFLLILLPGVIGVMVGLPLALLLANRYENTPGFSLWLMTGPALALVLGIALRYFSAWLVKDAPDPWTPKTTPSSRG